MQTPLNQTLAYAVSQLRADFVAFSSRKLRHWASPRDFSTLFSISGVIRGVPPPIFRRRSMPTAVTPPQHPQAGRNRVRDPQGPSHRPAGQCTGTHRQGPSDHGSQPGYVCRMGRLSAGTGPRRPVPSAPGTAPDLLPHLRYSPAIPDRPDGPPALRGRMPE